MSPIEMIGLLASVALPLWNIPLIIRIVQRKSSTDISLMWVMGVWGCSILMAPAGFLSSDITWRAFTVINLVLFTGVVIAVLKYRKKK